MIVLDASALLELILNTPAGHVVARHIADPREGLHVPHLADVDVAQALRRFVREGAIGDVDARDAIETLRDLDVERHAHEPLLDRVWDLRNNLTAYDAVYVALAEALDARLMTCDAPLSRAVQGTGRVVLVQAPRAR